MSELRSRTATDADLVIIASWIRTPQDCECWAGPDFPYPASLETLVEKLQVQSTTSVCLMLTDKLIQQASP